MTTSREDHESLEGSVEPREPRDWLEEALSDDTALRAFYDQLALPASIYESDQQALQRFRSETEREVSDEIDRLYHGRARYGGPDMVEGLALEIGGSRKRRTIARFRDWLNRREYRVDATEERLLEAPVFLLAAPDVPGCRARFAQERQRTVEKQWLVTIFGSGGGPIQAFDIELRDSFSAASPIRKLVFAPIAVSVDLVSVLRDERLEGHGLRIRPLGRSHSALGARVVRNDEFTAVDPSRQEQMHWLAGDTTGDVSNHELSAAFRKTYTFSLGLDFAGAKSAVKTTIRLTQKVELDFELVGGHDYARRPLSNIPGLHWRVDPAAGGCPGATAG